MIDSIQVLNRLVAIVDPQNRLSTEEILKIVEEKFTSTNSGSPKCYCCGSGNVVIECGDCKEKRVFGTWSEQ